MNCMKCGREISDDQIFCPACLELMKDYPVKADISVQIPHRPEALPKKPQPRKKAGTPEEQIQRLKRRNRWLVAAVGLLLAVTLALAYLSIDYFHQLDMKKFWGQNYSTVETGKAPLQSHSAGS